MSVAVAQGFLATTTDDNEDKQRLLTSMRWSSKSGHSAKQLFSETADSQIP